MRLIVADKLIKKYQSMAHFDDACAARMVVRDLEAAPIVVPENERIIAEWEQCDLVKADVAHGTCIHYVDMAVRCSYCKHAYDKFALWDRNFCPGCGAKMVNAEAENVNQ